MTADGGNQINLTNFSQGNDFEPAWSPDGTKIAFGRLENKQASVAEIYIMNTDGTNQTRAISVSNIDAWAPAWQPLSQSNPLDDPKLFVRRQYLDFLNREPDASGLGYWVDQITQCGIDEQCVHDRRVATADAFLRTGVSTNWCLHLPGH